MALGEIIVSQKQGGSSENGSPVFPNFRDAIYYMKNNNTPSNTRIIARMGNYRESNLLLKNPIYFHPGVVFLCEGNDNLFIDDNSNPSQLDLSGQVTFKFLGTQNGKLIHFENPLSSVNFSELSIVSERETGIFARCLKFKGFFALFNAPLAIIDIETSSSMDIIMLSCNGKELKLKSPSQKIDIRSYENTSANCFISGHNTKFNGLWWKLNSLILESFSGDNHFNLMSLECNESFLARFKESGKDLLGVKSVKTHSFGIYSSKDFCQFEFGTITCDGNFCTYLESKTDTFKSDEISCNQKQFQGKLNVEIDISFLSASSFIIGSKTAQDTFYFVGKKWDTSIQLDQNASRYYFQIDNIQSSNAIFDILPSLKNTKTEICLVDSNLKRTNDQDFPSVLPLIIIPENNCISLRVKNVSFLSGSSTWTNSQTDSIPLENCQILGLEYLNKFIPLFSLESDSHLPRATNVNFPRKLWDGMNNVN